MRHARQVALPLLLSVLLLAAGDAVARITHTRIRGDDRSVILLSRPFGFGADGRVQLNLTSVSVKLPAAASDLDLSKFGIYLADSQVDPVVEDPAFSEQFGAGCGPGQSPGVPLALFSDAALAKLIKGGGKGDDGPAHFHAEQNVDRGVREVFFASCDRRADVGFDIDLEMANHEPGGRWTYLSVGEMPLPTMYLVFGLLFAAGTAAFGWSVWTQRANAHRVHHLMAVLGVFKALTLLALCGMYHYIRVTGAPDGWNDVYYVFTFFRALLLFTVIVLIGTGWSYMTPHLSTNEKRVLMIVIPLQVFSELALIVTDDYTPAAREWFALRDVFHFVDIVCCCAVLFPIVWRIRHLREAASTDGKAERSMNQLIMFRQFYIMVVVYIYFTRIVVFLLENTLPADFFWLSDAANELAALVFYTLTAVLFRPYPQNQYFRLIADQDLEMSAL